MLHIVTLSRRITRRLLLESKYPSAWHLKGIIDNVAGTLRQKAMAAPQPTESESRLGAIGDKHPADMVLRWLEASSFVKRQQQLWEASKAFATIFAVSNGVSVASVLGQCRHMSGEVLRKARVRLDIISMLFFATSGRHLRKLTSTFTLIHHPRLGAWKCLQSVWIFFIEVLLHHGSGAFCH